MGLAANNPAAGDTRKCPHCGSDHLQAGDIWARAGLRFRPEPMRFLTLSMGAHITTTACMQCGAIALWADVEEIKSLLKENP
jgi:hypothetical protein